MKKNITLGLVAGLLLASVAAQADTIKIAWGYPGSPATATISPSGLKFKTFCLEDSEYIRENYAYNFNTGSTIVYGGPSGSAVTTGTVNLYLAYFSGAITDAGLVQRAIWYDQGYSTFGTADVLALGAAYLDTSAYSGIHLVTVYNLYSPGNADGLDNYNGNGIYTQRQSFIRLPDGGTTVILLGAGLLGLGLVYRRFALV
jgi:hypothetical protein